MNSPMNVLPSTSDIGRLPRIAGAQEDLVLTILENAERRYRHRGTETAYIAPNGAVCAVGAVLAGVGVKGPAYGASPLNLEPTDPDGADVAEFLCSFNFEQTVIDAAKEAIEALNEAALELYPHEVDEGQCFGADGYAKAIEALNQHEGLSWGYRRKMVLRCYARAIELRKALVCA